MNSQDFILFSLQITAMLACAVIFGQLMRKFGQPAVLGEMIGGIILGPTIFGAFFPDAYAWLFKSSANVTMVRETCTKFGMLFFLFVVGAEINLADLKRLGRAASSIGLFGTILPIAAGIGLVYFLPKEYWGPRVQTHFLSFALFIGMNLANSANPVIARILMDLKLLKKEIGTVIMTATIVDDLINWTLFAIILNNVDPLRGVARNLTGSIGSVVAFFVVVSVVGRWIGKYAFHWLKVRLSWPTGFVGATILGVLLASTISEQLGIHAFLGAFLMGMALGGGYDDKERNEVRDVFAHFALSFFAPIYFVSMGLNANFITHFDPVLILIVILVACLSKIGSVLLGAWAGGMAITRETLAIGFGLNARGATGIILAGVGLEHKVIDERIFVAIVVMALFTSLTSGPMIKFLLTKTHSIYHRA